MRAVKDWCANPQLHERQIRALQTLNPPVNVLTTHSAWLLSSLVLGCNGLLSGSGSVIADLQVRLFQAVQRNDLAAARQIHDRISPTAEVFYAEPWVDMHNRMKEALVLLGKLPRAVVRPPLVKISAAEIERIRDALVAAGLLADAAQAEKSCLKHSLRARCSTQTDGGSHGKPFVHVELNTTDVAKAKAFYGKLFDWKMEDVPMPDFTYTIIRSARELAGGLMKNPMPGVPSSWLAYVLVDDITAATQKAKSLGAEVIKEVTEVKDIGWLSIIMDPTGAGLGLWKPKSM